MGLGPILLYLYWNFLRSDKTVGADDLAPFLAQIRRVFIPKAVGIILLSVDLCVGVGVGVGFSVGVGVGFSVGKNWKLKMI